MFTNIHIYLHACAHCGDSPSNIKVSSVWNTPHFIMSGNRKQMSCISQEESICSILVYWTLCTCNHNALQYLHTCGNNIPMGMVFLEHTQNYGWELVHNHYLHSEQSSNSYFLHRKNLSCTCNHRPCVAAREPRLWKVLPTPHQFYRPDTDHLILITFYQPDHFFTITKEENRICH